MANKYFNKTRQWGHCRLKGAWLWCNLSLFGEKFLYSRTFKFPRTHLYPPSLGFQKKKTQKKKNKKKIACLSFRKCWIYHWMYLKHTQPVSDPALWLRAFLCYNSYWDNLAVLNVASIYVKYKMPYCCS